MKIYTHKTDKRIPECAIVTTHFTPESNKKRTKAEQKAVDKKKQPAGWGLYCEGKWYGDWMEVQGEVLEGEEGKIVEMLINQMIESFKKIKK